MCQKLARHVEGEKGIALWDGAGRAIVAHSACCWSSLEVEITFPQVSEKEAGHILPRVVSLGRRSVQRR